MRKIEITKQDVIFLVVLIAIATSLTIWWLHDNIPSLNNNTTTFNSSNYTNNTLVNPILTNYTNETQNPTSTTVANNESYPRQSGMYIPIDVSQLKAKITLKHNPVLVNDTCYNECINKGFTDFNMAKDKITYCAVFVCNEEPV